MTSLLTALLLIGCSGPKTENIAEAPVNPEPSPTPVPSEEPPAPTPAPGGSLLDTLLAVGACAKSENNPDFVRTVKELATSDGRPVYEVSCEMFAYQGTYDYFLGPPESAKQLSVDVLGLPEWDAVNDRLHWFEKARGPGDCGTYHEYQLRGDVLKLDVLRERACSDSVDENDDIPSAKDWNITGPATALTGVLDDLQNGDAACYVLYVDGTGVERHWYGDFDLCGLDALKGKQVVVTMGRGNVIAGSCEGDPECADSERVDLCRTITEVK